MHDFSSGIQKQFFYWFLGNLSRVSHRKDPLGQTHTSLTDEIYFFHKVDEQLMPQDNSKSEKNKIKTITCSSPNSSKHLVLHNAFFQSFQEALHNLLAAEDKASYQQMHNL